MSIEEQLRLMSEDIKEIKADVQMFISTLTTRKDVARFLNKSEKTIDNWVSNETFKEDIHYFYNEKSKIEFIPSAIYDFKKAPKLTISTKTDNPKKVYHKSVNSITKGLKRA